MSEEPAPKRMRNADEFPNTRSDVAAPVKEKLMELDAVQHQLDVMSEKAAEEILKVEQTFNKKRMPIYEKRKRLTTQISHFWQTAFLNHHLLSTCVPEEQEDLLGALRDLEVQEFEDLRSGFKIIMTFDPNDYFENPTITKSYFLQSESPSTEVTEITWKQDKKPPPKPEEETGITFLEWLCYCAPPDSDEIAEVIKDDLFINPLQYYVMPDMQEVEEDDIEDFLTAERGLDENGQPIRPVPPVLGDAAVDNALVEGEPKVEEEDQAESADTEDVDNGEQQEDEAEGEEEEEGEGEDEEEVEDEEAVEEEEGEGEGVDEEEEVEGEDEEEEDEEGEEEADVKVEPKAEVKEE